MNFHSAVVGVDGSEASMFALLWAAMAVGGPEKVHLVHAVHPVSDVVGAIVNLDPDARAHQAERAMAEDWLPLVPGATGEIRYARAGDALTEVVTERGADGVVVGEHGWHRWTRGYVGSTASKLLHRISAPVVIVPVTTPLERWTEVVVGIDGDPANVATLTWAARMTATHGGRLRVVSVVEHHRLRAAVAYAGLDLEVVRSMLEADVDAQVDEHARPFGIPIETEVTIGDPVDTLVDAAENASLLVIGRRFHGSMSEFLLGSNGRWCVGRSRCPVATVPIAHPT